MRSGSRWIVAVALASVAPAAGYTYAWARHNGCTSGPAETPVGTEIARLGPTTKQVSATDELRKFFAAN